MDKYGRVDGDQRPKLEPGHVTYIDKNGVATNGPLKGHKLVDNYDPKRAAGASKLPLSYIPPSALVAEAKVFVLGAKKYGAYNFTENRMSIMTYINAMKRHIMDVECGIDADPESGESPLAHIRCCAGILIEQQASGMIIDDRPNWTNPTGQLAGPYPAPKEET